MSPLCTDPETHKLLSSCLPCSHCCPAPFPAPPFVHPHTTPHQHRAGYLGGEYTTSDPLTSKRNGREQHSFHLHGYHAWQARRGVSLLFRAQSFCTFTPNCSQRIQRISPSAMLTCTIVHRVCCCHNPFAPFPPKSIKKQVGMGMGAWSPEKVSTYNLEDPPLRDTTTGVGGRERKGRATVAPQAWTIVCCAAFSLHQLL